ncbi:MAG: AAA family ATPase, partial [Alistipes sp.]|nr:AAA family ATPase [Alistipes sp.]
MLNTYIARQIYEKISFQTTFSQKKVVEMLSDYLSEPKNEQIFILNGYAGTGKTTLLAALVAVLESMQVPTVLLAPTGRAAKVLSKYSNRKALTIHKRIYRERTTADYESHFTLDVNKERGAVFIVDEASMLADSTSEGQIFGSGSLLDDLIKYVRSGKDCRLILVGDNAQLPPVGSAFSPALDEDVMRGYGDVVYASM